MIVEVRSHPFSKYATHFDTPVLSAALERAGMRYVFLGRELGGRPAGGAFYDDDGYVLYARVAASPRFREGVRRLLEWVEPYRLAILCSEEDPASCHRRLLVGRVLSEEGIDVTHIRGDGRVQTEAELVQSEQAARPDAGQLRLFDDAEDPPWRSTRSVLRRGPRTTSSPR